jgi:hypothetical protein
VECGLSNGAVLCSFRAVNKLLGCTSQNLIDLKVDTRWRNEVFKSMISQAKKQYHVDIVGPTDDGRLGRIDGSRAIWIYIKHVDDTVNIRGPGMFISPYLFPSFHVFHFLK